MRVEGHTVYNPRHHGLNFNPVYDGYSGLITQSGIASGAIYTFEIVFDLQNGRLLYPEGQIDAFILNQATLRPPAMVVYGGVQFVESYEHLDNRSVVGLSGTDKWSVYHDAASGWFCIGGPHISENCVTVEYATDCLAVILENRLIALWWRPALLEKDLLGQNGIAMFPREYQSEKLIGRLTYWHSGGRMQFYPVRDQVYDKCSGKIGHLFVELSTLQIVVSASTFCLLGVQGKLSHLRWVARDIALPASITSDSAKWPELNAVVQRGESIRYYPAGTWPVYWNQSNGWICFGKPNYDGDYKAMEFADNCIWVTEDGEPAALWLRPRVCWEC